MSDLLIRPVRASDADAIHELRIRAPVAELITAYPSERALDTQRYVDRWGANDHVFVAELAGRVVGYVGLHVRDGKARHSAWLGIAVHDEFHGRGIGRALVEKVLDLADRWLGLVRVDLTVVTHNERAVKLYGALGFVHEGTQKKATYFDGTLHDLYMMARIRE